MNTQADIPRLIREFRQRTGLTQEKFAAKPSPLAVQRIEELLRSMGDNGTDLLKRYLESKNYGVIP